MRLILTELGLFGNDAEVVDQFPDRLYGRIQLTPLASRLLATREMSRLRRVAHLGLLDGMVGLNASASKFEHSVGVYWLMIILTRFTELRQHRDLLTAVALAHDMGSPPFTHSSEPVMGQILGLDHEELIGHAPYADGEFANVVTDWGLDYAEVCALVQGRHDNPLLQSLINGALDLDTLDGTCRYNLMWRPVQRGLPYRPDILAFYYVVEDGRWVIRDTVDWPTPAHDNLCDFVRCRQAVFEIIHGEQIAGPESLIGRALYLAAQQGLLPPEFFWKTDEQAYQYLVGLGPPMSSLMDLAGRGVRYQCAIDELWQEDQISEAHRLVLEQGIKRQEVADTIARRLGLPDWHVTVHMGRSKGSKNFAGLRMLDDEGQPMELPARRPHWFLRVFLHPGIELKPETIWDAVELAMG